MTRFLPVLLLSVVPLAAGEIRIGVLSLFQPKLMVVKPARDAWLRLAADDAVHVLEAGQAAALKVQGSLIECAVQHALHRVRTVEVTSRDGGAVEFVLAVPGKIERRFQGKLKITSAGGRLQAVVITDLESAVAAAVLAETAPHTPLEALKAQAVVARSYYFTLGHVHNGFDFCDTTHCQFFRTPPGADDPAAKATRVTEGMIITWRGAPVATQYCAACGGRTRSMQDARLPAVQYPYYSVECPYCQEHEPSWESRLDYDEAAGLLDTPGSERLRLQIIRRLGTGALPGSNYTVSQDGDKVVLHGRGRGHGIGMCQAGAYGMARDGAHFREIVSYYFPSTAIELGRLAALR
jgi:stage II sporulation protein D